MIVGHKSIPLGVYMHKETGDLVEVLTANIVWALIAYEDEEGEKTVNAWTEKLKKDWEYLGEL